MADSRKNRLDGSIATAYKNGHNDCYTALQWRPLNYTLARYFFYCILNIKILY